MIDQLKAREPREIVNQLALLETDKRPVVTLHMRTGKAFQGVILDSGINKTSRLLLIQLTDGFKKTDNVTYLSVDQIDCVTVHNAKSALDVLSQGELQSAPSGPAPTKLGLSRRVNELSSGLSNELGSEISIEINWNTIPGSEQAMINLSSMVEDTCSTLKKLIMDYGASEIQKSGISRFRLSQSELPDAVKQDQVISITGRFDKGPAGRLTPDNLKKKLESLL